MRLAQQAVAGQVQLLPCTHCCVHGACLLASVTPTRLDIRSAGLRLQHPTSHHPNRTLTNRITHPCHSATLCTPRHLCGCSLSQQHHVFCQWVKPQAGQGSTRAGLGLRHPTQLLTLFHSLPRVQHNPGKASMSATTLTRQASSNTQTFHAFSNAVPFLLLTGSKD